MTNVIEQGRKLAEEQFKDGGFVEKLNAYECDGADGCGSFIVTIDRHPGVTPFMLRCGNCGKFAHSKMYRVLPSLTPTHEWYRPDSVKDVPLSARDHVAQGGLVLRAIGDDKWRRVSKVAFLDQASAMRAKMMAAMRKMDLRTEDMKRTVMSDSPLDRANFPSRQAWRRAKRGKR